LLPFLTHLFAPHHIVSTSSIERHQLSLIPSSISTSKKRFALSSPLKAATLNVDSDPTTSLKNDGKFLPPLSHLPFPLSFCTLTPPILRSTAQALRSNCVNSPSSCIPLPGFHGGPRLSAIPSQASSSSSPTPSSPRQPAVVPRSLPAISSATAISSQLAAYAWVLFQYFGPGASRASRNASVVQFLSPRPLSR